MEMFNQSSSECCYVGQRISLYKETYNFFEKGDLHVDIVKHPPVVVVLPVQSKNEIYLVRQFRYPILEKLIEFPAGCVEKGEAYLDAAKRELKEETGITASDWSELNTAYSAPGFSDEKLYFFLAKNLTFDSDSPDFFEHISLLSMTFDELFDKVLSNSIQDLKTLYATLLLKEYLHNV